MSQTPAIIPDITKLLRDGQHFAERHGDRVHIIDSLTGNRYIMYSGGVARTVPTHFVESELPTGEKVWTEEGVNPEVTGGVREPAYNPTIIHLLCQEVMKGGGLTRLCGENGFPSYPVLRAWAKAHPWIDEHLEQARRDRAESMRDKALTEAELAVSKDPIDASSLRVDTYKWAAGVDHEKYNPKTKVEATINTPTQIVVYTGIDRGPAGGELPVRTVGESPATIPVSLQQYSEEESDGQRTNSSDPSAGAPSEPQSDPRESESNG